ncbi:MAG: nucleotidyltransferase [Chloroflexi bacterium]|nr:MAG: nucleotidyltransferase [Chloroflexota bacterium]
MQLTSYSDVNNVLEIITTRLKATLGDTLVGLYLEGSLVIGDFEPSVSDIDLVAALASDIDDQEFAALQAMHETLVAEHPAWYDRIEVCYISVAALASIKSRTSMIVNISPGEPIHRTEARREWLMNWYLTREKSVTLYGPSPTTIIEPISKAEFVQSVRDHAQGWASWVKDMRNPYAQSYAILTMCRALYAYTNGEQVSKQAAALWAQQQLPEWSDVIQQALVWRKGGKDLGADDAAHPRTVQFVKHVRGLILGS